MIRYCPNCWKEIRYEARTCPYCGKDTDETGVPFVERLLSTLRHPEPTRVGLAIDILAGRLREPRTVGPLIALLSTARDPAILKQAAWGLGLLGDRRAIPALIHLLNNLEAPFIGRREAALALGKLGGTEAELALKRALDDPRPSVATAARQALATLAHERRA